jgi:hypothetical protein
MHSSGAIMNNIAKNNATIAFQERRRIGWAEIREKDMMKGQRLRRF